MDRIPLSPEWAWYVRGVVLYLMLRGLWLSIFGSQGYINVTWGLGYLVIGITVLVDLIFLWQRRSELRHLANRGYTTLKRGALFVSLLGIAILSYLVANIYYDYFSTYGVFEFFPVFKAFTSHVLGLGGMILFAVIAFKDLKYGKENNVL